MSDPTRRRWFTSTNAVVAIGVLLPYLSRVPGYLTKHAAWLTDFFDGGIAGFLLIGAFNALCWGSVLLASRTYRHDASVWVPAVFGFAFAAWGYATLDLRADPQAAIGLIFIPIYSLPLVGLGWMIGLLADRL